MENKLFNVLFICTGNSARSIFAECITNRLGRGSFQGFSAGSYPEGQINQLTIYELEQNNYDTSDLRSKSWEELAGVDAPHMDFVFTVCDRAAAEPCPVWPGQPMTAHWGVADPTVVQGQEWQRRAAFHKAFAELQNRISIFVNLPIQSLDKLKLQKELDQIGRTALEGSTEKPENA